MTLASSTNWFNSPSVTLKRSSVRLSHPQAPLYLSTDAFQLAIGVTLHQIINEVRQLLGFSVEN